MAASIIGIPSPADLRPLFAETSLGSGVFTLVDVEVVDGGHSLSGSYTLQIFQPHGAAVEDAQIHASFSAPGSVVRVEVATSGAGYEHAPKVTVAGPPVNPGSRAAKSSASLLGGIVRLVPSRSGTVAAGLPVLGYTPASGNALQLKAHSDDFVGGYQVHTPLRGAYYYNIKADPNLRKRFPAIPADNAMLSLNGVEQAIGLFNESTGVSLEDVTILAARSTLYWTPSHRVAAPWDEAYCQLADDLPAGGGDSEIKDVGTRADGYSAWMFRDHLYVVAGNRNTAWIHLSQTSRFARSGNVASMGVMAPLRMIDVLTGDSIVADGRLHSGHILLTLDDQANFFQGPQIQVDLTKAGELKTVFKNETGRSIVITAIMLVTIHQVNSPGTAPTEIHAAKITAGTQNGSYRDIIRETINTQGNPVPGVTTGLFALSQVKEVLPDSHRAHGLLLPGDVLYLRVESPANSPVSSQIANVYVKGHVI